MRIQILILSLYLPSLWGCSVAKQHVKPGSQSGYNLQKKIPVLAGEGERACGGTYQGVLVFGKDKMEIQLKNVDGKKLSSYEAVKPKTGGDRIFVYFNVDPGMEGADYNLFIYNDHWTLRKASKPGFYSIELAQGNVLFTDQEARVSFDSKLLEGELTRCWNYQMGNGEKQK